MFTKPRRCCSVALASNANAPGSAAAVPAATASAARGAADGAAGCCTARGGCGGEGDEAPCRVGEVRAAAAAVGWLASAAADARMRAAHETGGFAGDAGGAAAATAAPGAAAADVPLQDAGSPPAATTSSARKSPKTRPSAMAGGVSRQPWQRHRRLAAQRKLPEAGAHRAAPVGGALWGGCGRYARLRARARTVRACGSEELSEAALVIQFHHTACTCAPGFYSRARTTPKRPPLVVYSVA